MIDLDALENRARTHEELHAQLAEADARRGGETKAMCCDGEPRYLKLFPDLLAWVKAWFLADTIRCAYLQAEIQGRLLTAYDPPESSIWNAIGYMLRMTDAELAEDMLEAEGRIPCPK